MPAHKPLTAKTNIRTLLIIVVMTISCLTACQKKEEARELFHRFPEANWARFNILSFEMPVEEIGNAYDVYLFARFAQGFPYETLNFNMVMNTAAGEERIMEYEMRVRSKSGGIAVECRGDSCQGMVLLKKELLFSKKGVLKIEIENLTPRLNTEGVLGVGIRMVPSGK